MGEKAICISARRAIIIAAEHAGVKPERLGPLSLERDEGAYYISFSDSWQTYSYVIDVTTGEVMQFSNELS